MEGHTEFGAFLLDRLKTFAQEEAAFNARSGSSVAVVEEAGANLLCYRVVRPR
jgi:hypothetical protein